jgi:formate C-acetyltransferase
MDLDGRALVTKSSYRMLHTLYNLGPAPEPNITVLWSNHMPRHSSATASRSAATPRPAVRERRSDAPVLGRRLRHRLLRLGMRLGKQMQFFGARVNLAKALLYAINGGRDEVSAIRSPRRRCRSGRLP